MRKEEEVEENFCFLPFFFIDLLQKKQKKKEKKSTRVVVKSMYVYVFTRDYLRVLHRLPVCIESARERNWRQRQKIIRNVQTMVLTMKLEEKGVGGEQLGEVMIDFRG